MLSTDLPFHNLSASKYDDRQALCSSETSFESFQNCDRAGREQRDNAMGLTYTL